MLLVLDNGSIYTENLITFLNNKKICFEKHVPQFFNFNSFEKYDSIILSGRRRNDMTINKINSQIILRSIENNIKLLGICYGAEILALTLGGTIRKTQSLQKGIEIVQTLQNNSICDNSLSVFESHRFEISKLPHMLIQLATSKNCKYEVIQYDKKKIFGTQFHPEMSEDGQNLIEKFCLL